MQIMRIYFLSETLADEYQVQKVKITNTNNQRWL